jgi:hypothetical protein
MPHFGTQKEMRYGRYTPACAVLALPGTRIGRNGRESISSCSDLSNQEQGRIHCGWGF